jgi:hypothetical protein
VTAVESATAQTYRKAVRTGLIVAVALAALTVIEFVIAVAIDDPLVYLLPFVIAKALLIMDYYMHIRRLKGTTGGH